MEPRSGAIQSIKISVAQEKRFNFYKLVPLGTFEGKDVISCALRYDGWATLLRDSVSGTLSVHSHDELDVVDVCSIASPQFPFATAVLGIDRSLYFLRNAMEPQDGTTLRLDSLRGVAYQVFSSRGHVILLTSEYIYIFKDLVSRFLGGHRVGGRSSLFEIPLEAVDAYSVCDRWIIVIMPDGNALMFKVDDLVSFESLSQTSEAISMPLPAWDTPCHQDLAFATVATS